MDGPDDLIARTTDPLHYILKTGAGDGHRFRKYGRKALANLEMRCQIGTARLGKGSRSDAGHCRGHQRQTRDLHGASPCGQCPVAHGSVYVSAPRNQAAVGSVVPRFDGPNVRCDEEGARPRQPLTGPVVEASETSGFERARPRYTPNASITRRATAVPEYCCWPVIRLP